jgi:glyoxylase-like metal-dependent hydrolase (beta-lactamase superfamily II)
MLRKIFVVATPLAALAAAAMMLSAQAPAGAPPAGGGKGKAAPPPTIVQIKPGLYEVVGLGGNTSVRVSNDGVFVADTKNMGEENYTQLVALIKSVTPQSIKGAAVTHIHQDHSGNTASFIRDGVPVWAHEGEKALTATYVTNGNKVAAPDKTFAKDQNITMGNARIELHNYGPTHTSGDTVVYFPDLRVVHGGDMIVGTAPNCDFANGGSVVNWAKAIDEVLKLDFDTLIPGHGDPMTKAQVVEYGQKWKTFVDRALAEVRKGTPKEALIAAIKVDDLAPFATASYGQRLDGFWADLQKAK